MVRDYLRYNQNKLQLQSDKNKWGPQSTFFTFDSRYNKNVVFVSSNFSRLAQFLNQETDRTKT